MPKNKIVFYETFGHNKKYLNSKLSKSFVLDFVSEPLSFENAAIAKNMDILGVFVGSKVTKDVIKSLPKLKLIVTMSTGFDHIDVGFAKSRGITVCNVPTYGENTVAEHAFSLILALSRKLFESNTTFKQGGFYSESLMGFDLKDKTLGILGCGNIGKHLAKMAHGFDMKVLAYDVNCDLDFGEKFNLTYTKTVDEVLQKSDIISLHLPLNDHTKHIINAKSITKLKTGVVLINTARGGLIDSLALYEGLMSGKIGGAGLDVFEEENFIKEEVEYLLEGDLVNSDLRTVLLVKKIINHEKVIATPHNAFNSKEAVKRIMDTTIKNILNFKLNTPVNTVKA